MQTLQYNVFDPSACSFPAPRVPLLPVFTRVAGAECSTGGFSMIGAGLPRRTYTRGRYALFDACRLSGVGARGSLLAPAYHCRTMLDPAIRLGAPVLLYSLGERFVPDVADLQRLVRAATQPVRALLLTHFFGLTQAVEPIRAFCDAHDIALIEDCSHALFDFRGARRLGELARYTTASPYKLLPCEEGGLLIAGPGAPLPELRPAGLRAEVKVLANALERSWTYRNSRRTVEDLNRLDADVMGVAGTPLERGTQSRADLAGTSALYDERDEALAGSMASRWLMRLCDIEQVAARRRAIYRQWSEAVRGVPHCRAMFETLPDKCVPYMFPLLIENPQTHFYMLKKLGVPIWRWDDMADSSCRLSQHYREHLLHLPCHQALSDIDMAWMTGAVAKVMCSKSV